MNKFDGLGFIFGWVGINRGQVFGLFLHVELPHWVELHHFCFPFRIGLSENKRNLSQEGGREGGRNREPEISTERASQRYSVVSNFMNFHLFR